MFHLSEYFIHIKYPLRIALQKNYSLQVQSVTLQWVLSEKKRTKNNKSRVIIPQYTVTQIYIFVIYLLYMISFIKSFKQTKKKQANKR